MSTPQLFPVGKIHIGQYIKRGVYVLAAERPTGRQVQRRVDRVLERLGAKVFRLVSG